MRKVTFRFPDERSLLEFAKTIKGRFAEINLSELTVTCNCEEAETELAVNAFNAQIINKTVSFG
jgi:hypothetical protein